MNLLSSELVIDNPHNSGYFSDEEDKDDENEYGEEFTEHELNVYKCIRSTTANQHGFKSAVSSELQLESPTSPIIDFQGTIKPPRSIVPKRPDYEALRKHFT